ADRNIARIGATLNDLLDGVTADRRRMRKLAAQVISAGDEERAHIARELHDSTAQSLSALEFMLAAALRDPAAAAMHDRVRVMHEVVTEALGEVRTLSHNVHPRVLDDLGLVAALEFLVRRTREQTTASVHVSSDVQVPVPAAVSSVVYRVAQEAVRNAVRHSGASDIHLSLAAGAGQVRLEVKDDGAGFDVGRAMADRSGMGLFVMRERVMLVDGSLAVESRAGAGTRVRAEIPLKWDRA
ncbi:MAG TPA: sensor histidine kinase, partial [Longimicrobium sp.]